MVADLLEDGRTVTAKRMGWDEELSPEQLLDLDSCEHEDLDLRGVLRVVEGHVPGIGTIKVYLVGGQEADPGTIEDSPAANSFCPTGKGGGRDNSCGRPPQGPSAGDVGLTTSGIDLFMLSPEERKGVNKMFTDRTKLNKKVIGGTATQGDLTRLKEISERFDHLDKLIAHRKAAGEGPKSGPNAGKGPNPPAPPTPPLPPTLPPVPPTVVPPVVAPTVGPSTLGPSVEPSEDLSKKKILRQQDLVSMSSITHEQAVATLVNRTQKGNKLKDWEQEVSHNTRLYSEKSLRQIARNVNTVKVAPREEIEHEGRKDWTAFYSPSKKLVAMSTGARMETDRRCVLAHELAHALDKLSGYMSAWVGKQVGSVGSFPVGKFSGKEKFLDAWMTEIRSGTRGQPISEYAKSEPLEGFAEAMGYIHRHGVQFARTRIPKTVAFFLGQGLIKES